MDEFLVHSRQTIIRDENLLFLGKETIIHKTARIYPGVQFCHGLDLIMHEDTFIGNNCTILVPKLVMHSGSQICAGTVLTGKELAWLGTNVVIGYNCTLLTATDTPKGEFMNDACSKDKRDIRQGPITLRKNCFIGSQTLIMPGVTVAEGVVVRAQSYVNESLVLKNWIYGMDKHAPKNSCVPLKERKRESDVHQI